MEEKNGIQKMTAGTMVKVILFMYLLTGAGLMLLAFCMLKMDMTGQVFEICLLAVFALSGLFGGVLAGRMAGQRKFIWGFLAGLCYFAIWMGVSVVMHPGEVVNLMTVGVRLLLCTVSAMVGGMVS